MERGATGSAVGFVRRLGGLERDERRSRIAADLARVALSALYGAALGLWRGGEQALYAYAFVGGEVAWALRPFVASVYEPVAFLRPHALEGNLYEFILFDIVPHLARVLGF